MKARNKDEAFRIADGIIPTDYEYDTHMSLNAGYPIYKSTVSDNMWISDLGDRLEVNVRGKSTNIWIEDTTPLTENSNRYRRMNKSLFGDDTGKIKTFAIISAENPLAWKDSTDDEIVDKYIKWSINPQKYNAEARADMKNRIEDLMRKVTDTGEDALSHLKLSYAPIKGSYDGAREKTYLIFNLALKEAYALARDFGQESFFFGKVLPEKSEIAYYKTTNFGKTYNLIEVSDKVVYLDDAMDFFSKYGFQYRIDMREFGADLPEYESEQDFEDSISESMNYLGRVSRRPTPVIFK